MFSGEPDKGTAAATFGGVADPRVSRLVRGPSCLKERSVSLGKVGHGAGVVREASVRAPPAQHTESRVPLHHVNSIHAYPRTPQEGWDKLMDKVACATLVSLMASAISVDQRQTLVQGQIPGHEDPEVRSEVRASHIYQRFTREKRNISTETQ